MIKNFRELRVWQQAHKLTLDVYKLTGEFPDSERFGITSQIRRSSSSVAANIVEGYGRKTTKEFIQFLYQARGSLVETSYFLLLSCDLGYIKKNIYEEQNITTESLMRQLNAFITSLLRK